jgi:hypothetical protein
LVDVCGQPHDLAVFIQKETTLNGKVGGPKPVRTFRDEQHLLPSAGFDCSTLTLSDPMSDLVRHYDFPVPDAFLDL